MKQNLLYSSLTWFNLSVRWATFVQWLWKLSDFSYRLDELSSVQIGPGTENMRSGPDEWKPDPEQLAAR